MRSLVRPAIAALSLLASAVAVAPLGAQLAPYHRYRTLETAHFHVHVAEGMEREGRVAGAAAERAYALLSRELVAPRGTIDLVVADDADFSNGWATPSPSNRIVVFAAPPVETPSLRLNEDWLGVVITHELTHIFQLDRAGGWWGKAQHVFGRVPLLFPAQYGPSWLTEGLAVYYESKLTEGGRLKDAEHRMIALAAALDDDVPRLRDLSLASPRFPGGTGAYAYGSLLVEYVARTYGDSALHRFLDIQSSQVNPFAIDRAARKAFGVQFSEAFDAWRDSLRRSVSARTSPLSDWHELGGRNFYMSAPRWLNDSTVVYVGTDGRETNAAWSVNVRTGARTRLGRRDAASASVPLANGGLLYAQPQFDGARVIRSDLYVTRNGVTTRLTHDARLVHPDVRADGRIVAVRLAPARSSLVLLQPNGDLIRALREAGPDETWSEPRWSPDGNRIAVVHRAHGGEQSIEVLGADGGPGCAYARSSALLASPSWSGDGTTVMFTNEASGLPQLEIARGCAGKGEQLTTAQAGIVAAELAPRTGAVAGVVLHGDGYHLGVGGLPSASVKGATYAAAPAPIDTQPLASGEYHTYHPWTSAAPRYWLPVIAPEAGGGTQLGVYTQGSDVVGRHAYVASLAVGTSNAPVTGGFAYRYAGFRQPQLDLVASQDWTNLGYVLGATGETLGAVLRRQQDFSFTASLLHPGTRRGFALSAGAGFETRRFAMSSSSKVALDPSLAGSYRYPRLYLAGRWSNVQRPLLSISPEDGITAAATARRRWRTDSLSATASNSIVSTIAGYKSLDLPGFAHHVLAARVAGGVADARTASSFEVGGVSGASVETLAGITLGEGRQTFSVRGFPAAAAYGTSALAGSVEYRAPLSVGGWGASRIPLFVDRSFATAFIDAGVASCASAPRYSTACSPAPAIGHTLASVGAEVGVSSGFLVVDATLPLRVGVAFPIAGRDVTKAASASAYLAIDLSF